MKKIIVSCIFLLGTAIAPLFSQTLAVLLPARSFQVYSEGEKYTGVAFLEVTTVKDINSQPIYTDCYRGICSNYYNEKSDVVRIYLFDSTDWDEIESLRSSLYPKHYAQATPLADKVVELPDLPTREDPENDLYMTFDVDTATFTRITPEEFSDITGKEVVERRPYDPFEAERRYNFIIFLFANVLRVIIVATIFYAGWFSYKFINTRKSKQKRT